MNILCADAVCLLGQCTPDQSGQLHHEHQGPGPWAGELGDCGSWSCRTILKSILAHNSYLLLSSVHHRSPITSSHHRTQWPTEPLVVCLLPSFMFRIHTNQNLLNLVQNKMLILHSMSEQCYTFIHDQLGCVFACSGSWPTKILRFHTTTKNSGSPPHYTGGQNFES